MQRKTLFSLPKILSKLQRRYVVLVIKIDPLMTEKLRKIDPRASVEDTAKKIIEKAVEIFFAKKVLSPKKSCK